MNQFNLKRPKRGESEDDLLEFQEEFLKNKNQQPAAQVIKPANQSPSKKQHIIEKEAKIDFEMDDKALLSVLTNVVEKPTNFKPDEIKSIGSEIPKIEKLNLNQLASTGTKKKSLFAQNLENKGKLKSFYPIDRVFQLNNLLENEKIKSIEKNIIKPTTSDKSEKLKQIITGDGLGNKKDAEQIHLENLERLAQMKPEEILQEQQKLIQQLDPKILSFIRKRKGNDTQAERMETDAPTNKLQQTEKDKEILNELPIKPDKKWLHMDKIEYEKLEWMLKPRNAVNNENEKGKSARFDFQGNVMSNTEEIPVTKALHHHGNEPDLAGYTLDELFHLARSKFNQQRVLALQTISNILAKCHQGAYYDIIKSGSFNQSNELDDLDKDENDKHNLLNQLIDGGVLYLLRWSLDDQTESIINVSLLSLKNLLQPTDQENILDLTFDLYRGQEMPSLYPFSELVDDISGQKQLLYKVDKNLNLNERKELDELSDEEYIKHDLIKGLFRMNLMARLYYLLDKYQPTLTSNQIINNIFMILFRCLRHSSEISYDFTEKFSNLVDLIVKNFMPKFFLGDELNNRSILQNLISALKLFRILCSSGSNLSFKLCKKYDLNNRLINYMAIFDSNTESLDLTRLQIESIRLFKVLTVYHSDFSQTSLITFSDSFELILKQFNSLILKFNSDKTQIVQAYISLFNNFILNASEDDKNLKLKYDMTTSVNSLVQSFTIDQFKSCFNNKPDSPQFDLNFISVCFNFISDYLEKIVHGSFFVFNSLINATKKPSESIIENLLMCLQQNETNRVNQLKFDDLIMSKLVPYSTFALDNLVSENLKKLNGNNLTYLPTLINDMTELKQLGCYTFLGAYFKLYSLCFKLENKHFQDKTTNMLLTNAYLKSYLKLFIKNETHINSFIRIKYENQMVYYCLKLVFNLINFDDDEALHGLKEDEKRFYYLVALNLMHKLKQGDEFYAQDIISTCIFNTNLWSSYLNNTEANVLIKHFEQLRINNDKSFPDFNYSENQSVKIDKSFITNLESVHIYDSLNQIKLTYLESNYLLNPQLMEHSRKLFNLTRVNLLFKSKFYSNKSLLDSDWIYSPIKYYLRKVQSKSKPDSKDEISQLKLIQTVSNSLKFIYLLEAYFNDYLDLRLDLTVRYIHLLYVYLFESEVFLDKQIETYLYLIYYKFSVDKRHPLENLKLNQEVPDIISFYDFYQSLLQHYDSTSFGDYLFSLYIIVPLQQQYPVKYRQLFWSDFFHLFKYIKFATESNKLLIPLKNFIHPYEKSLNMIRLYSQILLDGEDFRMISGSKFGYSILIAHLNSFIFEHANNLELQVEFNFKKLLVTRFMSLANDKLKHDVVYFKSLNSVTFDQEFYDELPTIRTQWLNQLNQE